MKDFIVRPLDVVVYNIHSPDQSQRSVCEKKLSRIELVLITESCFRKEKTCESFHDTYEIFFRKPLSKENFPVCHDLNKHSAYLLTRLRFSRSQTVHIQYQHLLPSTPPFGSQLSPRRLCKCKTNLRRTTNTHIPVFFGQRWQELVN